MLLKPSLLTKFNYELSNSQKEQQHCQVITYSVKEKYNEKT